MPKLINYCREYKNYRKPTIKNLGIAAIAQCSAFVKAEKNCLGFVYITASHNPPGYNGIKFGGGNAEVLEALSAKAMAEDLKSLYLLEHKETKNIYKKAQNSPGSPTASYSSLGLPRTYEGLEKSLCALLSSFKQDNYWQHYSQSAEAEQHAAFLLSQKNYKASVLKIFQRSDINAGLKKLLPKKTLAFSQLRKQLHLEKPQLLFDYNGSARLASGEKAWLEKMGLVIHSMNTKPGHFAHRIVPEGESLRPAEKQMSQLIEAGHTPLLGLVVDADGDRGTLLATQVVAQKTTVLALGAQLSFALAALSELVFLENFSGVQPEAKVSPGSGSSSLAKGKEEKKASLNVGMALVFNGATSLLSYALARRFQASCFASETGEANVLALSKKIHGLGYKLAICGEGSNGGSLIPPATVRDPLSLILSLIRLLYMQAPSGQSLCQLALQKWGINSPPSAIQQFRLLLDSLTGVHGYTSTAVFEEAALISFSAKEKLRLASLSGLQIKQTYLRLFRENFALLENKLHAFYQLEEYPAKNKSKSKNHFIFYIVIYRGAKSFAFNAAGFLQEQDSTLFQEYAQSCKHDAPGFHDGLSLFIETKKNKSIKLAPSETTLVHLWFRSSKTEPLLRTFAEVKNYPAKTNILASKTSAQPNSSQLQLKSRLKKAEILRKALLKFQQKLIKKTLSQT